MLPAVLAVTLLLNGSPVDFGNVPLHMKPTLENGVALVPVRPLMEAVGAKVEYKNFQIYVSYKGKRVSVWREYTRRYNSTRNLFYPRPLPAEPSSFIRSTSYSEVRGKSGDKIYRLFLPVGFLADTFGFSLKWDNQKKIVNVYTKS